MKFSIGIEDDDTGGVRIMISRSNELLDENNPPLSACLVDRIITLLDVYGAVENDIGPSGRVN